MEGIFSGVFNCSNSNLGITHETFRPQELKKGTYSSLNSTHKNRQIGKMTFPITIIVQFQK